MSFQDEKPATVPPPADPVMKAFEQLSAKMDQFNTTLVSLRDLLLEDRAWKRGIEDRVAALESIPPPTIRPPNGAADA